jgi:S-adenosylmethionine synthetase
VHIDVESIAINAAKKWLSSNLRFVDCDSLNYQVELKPGSAELTDVFARGGEVLGANDTSAAVGYAPTTPTENIVLLLEKHLNSTAFKKRFPESGEDVKVMGLRKKNSLNLTVAMPLISSFVASEKDYFRKKDELLSQIHTFAKEHSPYKVEVSLNTLDVAGRGLGGVYLTLTGTSAEDADCGQVGRGNRVNGIIPLNRPVSSEAAAGKNPVSHVGKIYNALTHKIAEQVYLELPDLKEVYVWLLSQIGAPIDQPTVAAVQVLMREGSADTMKKDIEEIIERELEHIDDFCQKLAKGKISIC